MKHEGDVTKLPKWAQSRIAVLERDLASAREKLAEGPEDSNTFADPYAAAPRPLGRDTSVEFHVGDAKIRVRVDHDFEGEYLDVNSSSNRLLVRPRASNSIEAVPTR